MYITKRLNLTKLGGECMDVSHIILCACLYTYNISLKT